MASRKKRYVLLRGVISGTLIVGSRMWYEDKQVAKTRRWKLITQSNDKAVLTHMAELGNKPSEPLYNDIDEWFDTKLR